MNKKPGLRLKHILKRFKRLRPFSDTIPLENLVMKKSSNHKGYRAIKITRIKWDGNALHLI